MEEKTIKEICDVVTEEVMKQVRKNLSAMKPDIIEQIKNSVKKNAIQETQRITDSKYNKIDNRISQLEKNSYQSNTINTLAIEKRIGQLEATIAKLTAKSSIQETPRVTDSKFNKIENRISQLENKNNTEKGNYQSSITALEKRIAQLELKGNNIDNYAYQSTIRTLENRIEQLEETIATLTTKQTEHEQSKAERILAKAVDGINTLSPVQIDDILSYTKLCREYKGWIYYIKKIDKHVGELYKVKIDGTQNQKIFAGKVEAWYVIDFHVSNDMVYFEDSEGNERSIRV